MSVVGLASCGHWYVCPFCVQKIATARRAEIEAGVAEAVRQGLTVAMLTLTVRHKRGDALAMLLDALGEGWRRGVGADKAVKALRKRLGWSGYIRALEVTDGPSGWHPHYHFLVFFDPEAEGADPRPPGGPQTLDPVLLDQLGAATLRAWSARLVKAGLKAPNRHGYDLRVLANPLAEVADYLTKAVHTLDLDDEQAADTVETVRVIGRAAYEMTGAVTKAPKITRSGEVLRRTHWEIVRDAAAEAFEFQATGELKSDAIPKYWEIEEAMTGRAQILWSRGLKKRLKVTEVTDEELLSEEVDPVEATILGLPREGIAKARHEMAELRHAAATTDRPGLAAYLDARGIEWLPADHPTLVADRDRTAFSDQDCREALDDLARQPGRDARARRAEESTPADTQSSLEDFRARVERVRTTAWREKSAAQERTFTAQEWASRGPDSWGGVRI